MIVDARPQAVCYAEVLSKISDDSHKELISRVNKKYFGDALSQNYMRQLFEFVVYPQDEEMVVTVGQNPNFST